ncbi:leucyl aminopeptidase [Streptomyces sp. NPDC094447]|uniref:leucyl aminopeptidase n=1 Tax=Streptomyces sp. NPDC094447 TaxID=3366062 RepID=UPI0037F94107
MTSLALSMSSAAACDVDAIAFAVHQVDGRPAAGPESTGIDQAFNGRLDDVLRILGATGAEGDVVKIPAPPSMATPLLLAVGLGMSPHGTSEEPLRRWAGEAARALGGVTRAALVLPRGDDEAVAAVALGALLGEYAFTRHQAARDGGRAPGSPAELLLLGAPSARTTAQDAVASAAVLAEEMNRARDLVNMPPNALGPADFAAVATAAAGRHGLDVEVLDEEALRDGGYGGILSVGQGSVRPPRLVRIAHTHPDATRTLAFVGKGITYDSGGISLKPVDRNQTMKLDMAGAAAVLAAVVTAARLELRVNVTGWLALAENMPSGSSMRPGDVLRMYGGRTVEVLNTDAEGRLVLADTLVRAGEEQPDALIDVATLTGEMMSALGTRAFGVMAGNDAFRERVFATATQAGEDAWPMPLPAYLRTGMASPVADLANMGERYGGGLSAGVFLQEFVADGIDWAHLDIAGPSFHDGSPYGYTPTGGTGASIRTLVRLAAETAAFDERAAHAGTATA